MKHLRAAVVVAVLAAITGCATESSRSVAVAKVESAATPYHGVRVPVSVGKFDNRSNYMRGIFTDGVDRLGGQPRTTLVSHLQQTQRFTEHDPDNISETRQEAQF